MSKQSLQSIMKTSYEAMVCKISASKSQSTNVTSSHLQSISSHTNTDNNNNTSNNNNSNNKSWKRQSPLLDRFYYSRQMIMSFMIQDYMEIFIQSMNSIKLQIVILGAGLDESYYNIIYSLLTKLITQNISILLIEVDLPEVIQKKQEYVNQQETRSSDYIKRKFLAYDLRDCSDFHKQLNSYDFEDGIETLFISEVVLCYLPSFSVNSLLHIIGMKKSTGLFYEPMIHSYQSSQSNGFFNMFISKFHERGASLLHFLTHEDWIKLLQQSNKWNYYTSLLSFDIFQFYNTSLNNNINDIFDEFGSLALLYQCYGMVITTNNQLVESHFSHRLGNIVKFHINKDYSPNNLSDLKEVYKRIQDIQRRLETLEVNATSYNSYRYEYSISLMILHLIF